MKRRTTETRLASGQTVRSKAVLMERRPPSAPARWLSLSIGTSPSRLEGARARGGRWLIRDGGPMSSLHGAVMLLTLSFCGAAFAEEAVKPIPQEPTPEERAAVRQPAPPASVGLGSPAIDAPGGLA